MMWVHEWACARDLLFCFCKGIYVEDAYVCTQGVTRHCYGVVGESEVLLIIECEQICDRIRFS